MEVIEPDRESLELSTEELDRIFEALADAPILVVGDFSLDLYELLDDSRSEISIETGLRTKAVAAMRCSPGGAGNVVANLAALGARRVSAVGVVGDDLYGREYVRLLDAIGVDVGGMVTQGEGWITSVYTKQYEGDRELPRIDFGNANRLSDDSSERLLETVRALASRARIVLVNQQLRHGIHTEAVRRGLAAIIAERKGTEFLVDTRDYVGDYFGALKKLNDHEAARAVGLDPERSDYRHIDRIRSIARELYERWKRPLFITRGDRGSAAFDGSELHVIPGLHMSGRIDTVGAGDSVLAGLAGALAAGYPPDRALLFASLVAGVTIGKLKETGTASEAEVRDIARHADYRLRPELAEKASPGLPQAGGIEHVTPRERLRSAGRRGITYAVFDHDGTISTLREGWESVMEPFMIRAITGDEERLDSEVRKAVAGEVHDFIDRTTGRQTLSQMKGLVEMVRRWGVIPETEILDAGAYKKLYLEKLDKRISGRTRRLEAGELDVGDLTIKGAVGFLTRLRDQGVHLFLASGTDEEDARREARLLGYEQLFDGGIFGAQDLREHEPKRAVLESIIESIGRDRAGEIVTFGDGPVEIRETWKRGGFCIGVASDELRRFGLNERKRSRLILAGADLIISDYSQGARLLEIVMQGW